MRVYNLHGRRDNKFKARIKILVHELGPERFRAEVEQEYARAPRHQHGGRPPGACPHQPVLRPARLRDAAALVAGLRDGAGRQQGPGPVGPHQPQCPPPARLHHRQHLAQARRRHSRRRHRRADARRRRSRRRYSFSEIRVTHHQNLVLPHVKLDDVPALWAALRRPGWPRPISGWPATSLPAPARLLLARHRALDPHRPVDLAALCRSCPPARRRPAEDQYFGLHQRLRPPSRRQHRHSRAREEGRGVLPDHHRRHLDGEAAIGTILGPGFSGEQVPDAVETIVNTYLGLRGTGRDVSRHLPPGRPPALQGGPLCRCLKQGRFVADEWLHLASTTTCRRRRCHRAVGAPGR
jgi:sulfite reductase (NADPH) hemoprotein beta-component